MFFAGCLQRFLTRLFLSLASYGFDPRYRSFHYFGTVVGQFTIPDRCVEGGFGFLDPQRLESPAVAIGMAHEDIALFSARCPLRLGGFLLLGFSLLLRAELGDSVLN